MAQTELPQAIDGATRNQIENHINSKTGFSIRNYGGSGYLSNMTFYIFPDWDRRLANAPRIMQEQLLPTTVGSPGISFTSTTPVITGNAFRVTNNNFAATTANFVTDGLGFHINKVYDPNLSDVRDARPFDIYFGTASTNIQISFKRDASAAGVVRVMMNGKPLTANATQTLASGVQTNYLFFGQFTDTEIYREFKVECEGVMHPFEITVSPSNHVFASSGSPSNGKRLHVFGDSTSGNYTSVNVPGYSAVRMVGNALGMDTYQWAYGSAGFSSMGNHTNILNQFKTEAHADNMIRNGDVIWVHGGASDVATLGNSLNTVQTNAQAFITYVRSFYPQSPIWLTPNPSYYDSPPSWYANYAGGLSNAAAANLNVHFWNTHYFSITSTNRIKISDSDLHLNIYGQQEQAAQHLREINKAINKTP